MVLFLNDIGTSEVVLILLFILIFFGAKSIPGLARTMGRTIRQVKDASNDIQGEIRRSGQSIKGDLNLKGIIKDTEKEIDDLARPLDQQAQDIERALKHRPINSTPLVRPNHKPSSLESSPKDQESGDISEKE